MCIEWRFAFSYESFANDADMYYDEPQTQTKDGYQKLGNDGGFG